MSTKSIWILEHEGSCAVVPVSRYEQAIRDFRRRADDCNSDEEGEKLAAELRSQADGMDTELKGILVKAKEYRYEIKPFTRRQRLKAKREATRWEGSKAILDEDLMHSFLIAESTGMPLGAVEDLDDNHAQALFNLVMENAYPSIPKLLTADSILPGSDKDNH